VSIRTARRNRVLALRKTTGGNTKESAPLIFFAKKRVAGKKALSNSVWFGCRWVDELFFWAS
jgi:hypothetical protein